ncbi:MAG: anthranilate synthase component I [Planctomycetota bacterium]|nr:anthranilate synthase component I [Planctomycetota bacterium]
MPTDLPDLDTFRRLATAGGHNLIPIYRRLLADQLTPVLAYRRLVRPDDRLAPSFLLESVVGGERIGRYSFMGAQPIAQVIARGHDVRLVDALHPERSRSFTCEDPMQELDALTSAWKLGRPHGLPDFTGGWVGMAGYDTVRYVEGEKLPSPPRDDRNLPDLHMGLYRQIVAFDHVQKVVLAITHVLLDEHASVEEAYRAGSRELDALVARIETIPALPPGRAELATGEVELSSTPPKLPVSSMGEGGYQRAVLKAKEYIAAGDVFQVVPSQRFELRTRVDPFDIYRALRIVNPSPYMFYLQIEGGMLVGSSPEILCRVQNGVVTNRPLAGTRRRGKTPEEDRALEAELLADPKERAEHIMLVDLGRNDVGRVATPGTIKLPDVMVVERYSHVMHISSTVTGELRPGCTCWDALRVALPVGTVSGAPKVRAMQIIDELEPTRRGPYGGAVGYADFAGNMDMAIALRTMVITPAKKGSGGSGGDEWVVHLQAGGGIVADSDPDAEHQETVNKAAALAKAVDLAERAFGSKR